MTEHVDEIPEVYQIESSEQIRVAADPLRQRIMQPLSRNRMTVTQVGELLGVAGAKIHYHVRELERVGLVRMVETREKGGILEKYYQAAGKNITVSPTLLRSMSPAEHVASIGAFLETVSREFLQTMSRAVETEKRDRGPLALSRSQFWATDEEASELLRRTYELYEPYLEPLGAEGERERTMVLVAYDTPEDADASEPDTEPEPREPKRHKTYVAGVFVCEREGIEKRLARGETADITVFGICRFPDDVPADLVDRYVAKFHHRGILQASPAVKAVLERKAVAAK